jgi:ABC-type proline/glycine betaine transport system ATPase subunit
MTTRTPRLAIQNLSLERNGRAILHNVNIAITSGEIVCLLGPSGSGKSSLLRCLNRLTEPDPQTVFLDGQDITSLDVLTLRRQVGMVFQNPALFPGSVAENVAYGPQIVGAALTPERIANLLALADLPPEYAARPATELSGGEAQRVSIARALANESQTLLLDEPTGALDPAAQRAIRETITKLRQELGLTVLWVTHNMEEVRHVADRVYLLLDGRIADEGTPGHLLRPDSHHLTAVFAAGQLE